MRFDDQGAGRIRRAAAMAAILLLAAALRLHGLAATDLWLDEAVTITVSNWSLANLLIYPVDPTPGLYYLLHKALAPAEASVLAVRLLPAAIGVATVPLMFMLGRTLFGVRAGWIAALLLAVWPPHVAHSQDARAYILLFATTLCMSLGIAQYARAWLGGVEVSRRRRLGALALYAFGAALALNTHVTAVFWVAGTAVLLLATAAMTGRSVAWMEVCVCGLASALLSSTALYRLVLEMSHGDSFGWLTQASLKDFMVATLQVLLPPGPYGDGLPMSRQLWYAGGALLGLLGASALYRNRLSITPLGMVASGLVLGYLAVPAAVWLVGFVTTPIFMPRTILYAASGSILLIALVLAKIDPRAGIVATALLTIPWGASAAFAPRPDREHWKEAGRQLAARVKPGDTVVLCPAWQFPPLRHASAAHVDAPLLGVDSAFGLLLLEASFGGDPQWAKSYHKAVEVPWAERQLRRELEDPQGPRPRPAIPMSAGSTLWLLEGGCLPEERARLDHELPSELGPPVAVWHDVNRYGAKPLWLFSRKVTGNTEFPPTVRSPTPRPTQDVYRPSARAGDRGPHTVPTP